ncbi:hypothetical protein PhCBS80983_g05304 [Powellomyces hirtus]|uniref:Uncharacterized protein n=1 Tax=Powellomyces hirtus TaxID=109895 RepID=A0A507DVY1_9FUNG|nr:hypothetical protein PhCBS80983_g05304 [Powellomyces hirtus]
MSEGKALSSSHTPTDSAIPTALTGSDTSSKVPAKRGVAFAFKSSAKYSKITAPSRSGKPLALENDDEDDSNYGTAGASTSLIDDPTYSQQQKKGVRLLLDPTAQFRTLRREGDFLASAGRFAEALSRWTQALSIDPTAAQTASASSDSSPFDAAREIGTLRESRAQAFMERDEWFLAVKEAEHALEVLPTWAIGWQTLGRAQLGFGEPTLSLESFDKALELNPAFDEVRDLDLPNARKALELLQKEGLTHARLDA